MINKIQLSEIIKDLIDVQEDLNLNITDTEIFSESCSFLRGFLAGESRGIQNYQKPKINDSGASGKEIDKETKPNSIKASDKQKSLMTKLKIPFTNNTTIKEAKELIEIKLGKKEYKEY